MSSHRIRVMREIWEKRRKETRRRWRGQSQNSQYRQRRRHLVKYYNTTKAMRRREWKKQSDTSEYINGFLFLSQLWTITSGVHSWDDEPLPSPLWGDAVGGGDLRHQSPIEGRRWSESKKPTKAISRRSSTTTFLTCSNFFFVLFAKRALLSTTCSSGSHQYTTERER